MAVDGHGLRTRIQTRAQHPLKHSADEFAHIDPALPDVNTVGDAIRWFTAVLYPQALAAVANPAALPTVGNSLNDYRVVTDDGDGKAAAYRWMQLEGDVTASWYKVYDMDWGVDSVLSAFYQKTQDIYVHRRGYDDLDASGVLLAGVNAGQHIFGGRTAGKHLTLHANSGDGVGAQTGYIQFADNVRPTVNSTWSLGTTAERWLKIWTDEITSGTMTLAAGSLVDSSGLIDMGATDLTTTGDITAGSVTLSGSSATFGTLTVTGGSITDTTGAIDFDDEDLSTAGTMLVGSLFLDAGSITDASGTIDFDDEDLQTTGDLYAANLLSTTLDVGNLYLSANTLTTQDVNGDLFIFCNGSGEINVQSTINLYDVFVDGSVDITSNLNIGNINLNGNDIRATDTDGNLQLSGDGAGLVVFGTASKPTTDGTLDFGTASFRWNKFYLDNAISDGTNEITIANLLTFRAVGSPSTGDALFWDGAKWVASNPDTEIDHGELTGIGDDDHTQYFLLAGRSGGQTAYGDTAASGNLTLHSTFNATKGSILFAGKASPATTDIYDIGASGAKWNNLYMLGEAIGMRVENYTTAGRPAASGGTAGRLYYDTTTEDLYFNRAGTWTKASIEKYVIQDAVGWTGLVTSVVYTVSADVSDARQCIWAFKANGNNFEQLAVEITMTQTQVTVTGNDIAAGTYTLVGIG